MSPDTDNDFHVKEVQDMVNVIQRMIKDGKVFEKEKKKKINFIYLY